MNTRLQVEHPVTELVTGVDLVEEMIRSAAGEPLRLKQADVKLTGWAVESRVYAEDPTRGFLPSTGRLTRYRPPAEGTHDGVTVRNDTGVYEGGEISIHYDPMIAKLVTHAPDRLAAIDAQATALDAFVIDGIRHNIPFLSALMQHPRWREGRLSTGFIAEEFPDGFHPLVAEGETERRLVVAATMIDHTHNLRKRHISGQLREPEQMRFELKRVVAMGKSPRRARDRAANDWRRDRVRGWPQGRGRIRTGSRAIPCGAEPSTAPTSPCRRARSSTAMRSPMPGSPSTRASTPAARLSSPR